ncbi:MAG: hypothetical protein WA148_06255 [Actinomycetota bacterium]
MAEYTPRLSEAVFTALIGATPLLILGYLGLFIGDLLNALARRFPSWPIGKSYGDFYFLGSEFPVNKGIKQGVF